MLCLVTVLPVAAAAATSKIKRAVHPVKDEYIVVLNDGLDLDDATAKNLVGGLGGWLKNRFETVNGFSVSMTDAQAER